MSDQQETEVSLTKNKAPPDLNSPVGSSVFTKLWTGEKKVKNSKAYEFLIKKTRNYTKREQK